MVVGAFVSSEADRRPIGDRNSGWAQRVAGALARTNITPNQISIASMAAAALAGLCLWQGGLADGGARAAWYVTGAALCQIRLLCNLFDGMVAVEGGKSSPDGPFWNEFPDRVADILILVGAGMGVGADMLGWAAAAFAIFAAYVRELGRAIGAGADYSGPMAKQHRMAASTLGALAAAFESFWGWRGESIALALAIIIAGAVLTVARRAAGIVSRLKDPP
jgi:phosphatidylglycerophosphate synthase